MKPSLSPIGQHLRSRAPKPGHATNPMRGSNKLPAFANPERQPRVVVVQVLKTAQHDPRYQVGEGEEVPEHFSAYLPGIDPATGQPWRER